jgi:uncharacterized protein (TIGR03905 family)
VVTIKKIYAILKFAKFERKKDYFMTYQPQGVCAQKIDFDIVDGKVTNVKFFGGCNGNTQGVARLVEGMEVNDAIARMEGIQCGFKGTSCPDQLARALKSALEN